MDKVRSTIKQFVRDWSSEGAEERERCYKFIIDEICTRLPLQAQQADNQQQQKQVIKVLTPGAGLGRLSWELAKRGYASQGNEHSFFMLIASNFILNRIYTKEQFTIYPFIHQRSNIVARRDQLRPIKIPDVLPSELPQDADFSMVAGDFSEVYNAQPNTWDCVATCFFIDTAKNVFEYIATINKCLKMGGLWVNYGPLLYHWAEMDGEFSIELSYDELREVILKMGFEIVSESLKNCTYTGNSKSMLQIVYKCISFTAIKKSEVSL